MNIVQRSPEPFFYMGGKTGILLVHGFTGTPSELRPMGDYFKERGYTVHAPLLAGHGTNPEDMATTRWPDWWKNVREAYDRLRQAGMERIFVIGHSMGGCLSLYLTTEEKVDGVISLCAPIWTRDRRTRIAGLLHYISPYKKRTTTKPPEIEAYLVKYDRTPLRCVASLHRLIRRLRGRLKNVRVPALIVQSCQDETVIPKSAQYIYKHIASEQKQLSWYEKSGHIITVDRERRKLFQEIELFIEQVLQGSQA